ncbi:MAG: hypothetical protein EOP09_13610 [Proteobacteria bacterium]|nr:MAG: hypothetical protein EOP09_13610 [Pseudomonadota bacterium]
MNVPTVEKEKGREEKEKPGHQPSFPNHVFSSTTAKNKGYLGGKQAGRDSPKRKKFNEVVEKSHK